LQIATAVVASTVAVAGVSAVAAEDSAATSVHCCTDAMAANPDFCSLVKREGVNCIARGDENVLMPVEHIGLRGVGNLGSQV
jgi:hypothetical protein